MEKRMIRWILTSLLVLSVTGGQRNEALVRVTTPYTGTRLAAGDADLVLV